MLELLGTIGANIISLPGILGLALGMMTRRLWLGGLMGAVVGVLETVIFAHWNFGNVAMVELLIAVVIGLCAGTLGSVIRIKGTTV
ncbi:hypothetical protein RUE5091_01995 [Ruegeria denitrificans]|uniref:Uncharacterized protein n=1 Tax=Ruegeria denitrificans TaxID=1715692 RepID=A0A0N7M9G2_9RHOB|nr:hypothetical protein [Ruegeria denitrificans]CUJ99027.1 hypothetical protein RUE5091_01995 [Ruegeria denitrificans]